MPDKKEIQGKNVFILLIDRVIHTFDDWCNYSLG